MEELALKIEHVSKEYRLGTIGGGTLKAELQGKFAKLRHKENPNLKIGQKEHDKNERFLALDDVSLEIKKGERVAIIGHNGAGKSTLLKLICRVTAPTNGSIYLNGRITSMLEVGTGFHNELTGKENIYLNGAILGMSRDEVASKYDQIVNYSEIEHFIDTPIKRYSSGMKIKLGFSVASHLDSEIMIMDEVLAVGDVNFQNKCIARMKEVAEEEGRTILYVSHNMATVRSLCDRCIVLEHGHVVYDGEVEEGIDVYLQSNNQDDAIFHDTTGIIRGPKHNLHHKITSIELLDKDDTTYEYGDKLRFKLCWDSLYDDEDLKMRMNIYEVGFAFAGDLSYSVGKNNCVFEFDTRNLVPGNYRASIRLYGQDSSGSVVNYDEVQVLTFHIKQSAVFKEWHPNWGKTVFSDINKI